MTLKILLFLFECGVSLQARVFEHLVAPCWEFEELKEEAGLSWGKWVTVLGL